MGCWKRQAKPTIDEAGRATAAWGDGNVELSQRIDEVGSVNSAHSGHRISRIDDSDVIQSW